MTEVWKSVKGFEGLYEVSNLGNVRNSNTKRILKPGKDKGGYLIVSLSKDCKGHTRKVHRLVGECFVENLNNLDCINHINEDKFDNRAENLEWCTRQYNLAYGTRTEREVAKKSQPVYQMLNGKTVRRWSSTKEAQRNGYNSGCISQCCNGIRKEHMGYEWQYAI